MTDQKRTSAGVTFPPPLITLLLLGAGIGLSLVWQPGWIERLGLPVRLALGGILFAAAAALLLSASGLFRRAKTSVKPWEPTSALVTTGIYRFTRNPMYVGFLLISFAVALFGAFDGVIFTTLILWGILHVAVIGREERYLSDLFGEEYTAFCQRVPRYGLFF